MKNAVFWKLYHVSKNAGTVLRIAPIQTISKNKNENQASRLGVESRIVKKRCFTPKRLNNVIWLKFVAEKGTIGTIQLLSTTWTCWKAILNIFIPDENIAI